MSKLTANRGNLAIVRFTGIISMGPRRVFVCVAALILGMGMSSRSFAQTISLGAAGDFALLDSSVSNSSSSMLTTYGDQIWGNVGVGQYTQITANSPVSQVFGNVYLGSGVSGPSGGNVTVSGSVYTSANLSAAIQAAFGPNGASAAASKLATNVTLGHAGTSYAFNENASGHAANTTSSELVYNFTSNVSIGSSMNPATVYLYGTAGQQFVFNFSSGLTMANTTFVLNGVSASNIIFNITGGTNSSITGTNLPGTILNSSGKIITLANDSISGSVISDGSVSMSSTVMAPEPPTILMPALAGLFVMGSAGVGWLRKRQASVRSAGSPLT